MKVAFIDPQGSVSGFNTGLGYLAAVLKQGGHEVRVLDFNNDPKRVGERIRDVLCWGPQVVGFSVKAGTTQAAENLAVVFKEKKITIIAGGPGITCLDEKTVGQGGVYDAYFSGESEGSLQEYLRGTSGTRLYWHGSAPSDLDELAFPDYSVFDTAGSIQDSYPLVTSRGCPYGCIYCSVRRFSGTAWRSRSPGNVVDELMRARQSLGIRSFTIADDNFSMDLDRAKQICRQLIAARSGLSWGCINGIRADRVDEELLRLMKEAGCQVVWFGVESLNEDIFDRIDKGEKLEAVRRSVRLAKQAGLCVSGFFIAGLPGSTYAKDSQSLELSKELGLDEALWSLATPYPGTKFWDWARTNATWLGDYRRGSFYKLPQSIIETPDYPARERLKMFYRGNLAGYSYSCFFPRRIGVVHILRFLYFMLRYDAGSLVTHVRKILFGRYHRRYLGELIKRVR